MSKGPPAKTPPSTIHHPSSIPLIRTFPPCNLTKSVLQETWVGTAQTLTQATMDITTLVVSARNQALLYGDYGTYHRQLAQKLHNARKKLNLSTKNRGKFSKKTSITAEQIVENHG